MIFLVDGKATSTWQVTFTMLIIHMCSLAFDTTCASTEHWVFRTGRVHFGEWWVRGWLPLYISCGIMHQNTYLSCLSKTARKWHDPLEGLVVQNDVTLGKITARSAEDMTLNSMRTPSRIRTLCNILPLAALFSRQEVVDLSTSISVIHFVVLVCGAWRYVRKVEVQQT